MSSATLPEGVIAKGPRDDFVVGIGELPVEFQTDKPMVKVCACIGCGAYVAVNVFYAPAITKCRACGGGGDRRVSGAAATGSQGVVQAGRTDPSRASNLADCLLNKSFAFALCPIDPSHDMELKSVSHNERYGPARVIGFDKYGEPLYKNDVGEVVMHQCNICKTSVSYSTTHQKVYRRQNEPKTGVTSSAFEYLLGGRAS